MTLTVLLAFAGLAVLSPVSYAQVSESEPNNDAATADGPFAGDQTVTASISPEGDQDFFKIVVTSASNYRFETPDDDEGAGCAAFAEDPVLRLFDSNGTAVGADDDSGEGFCARLERNLEAGTYFVSIEAFGFFSNEIPDYVLEIDRELADPPQCSDTLDNDSDGRTDFPRDPGCSSAADNDESNDPRPPARQCTINGTSGNDVLRGTSGADVICAGAGNDVVYGGGGNDTILGQGGNDALRGQAGSDRLSGGPGNDSLVGGPGNDRLSGGPGNDSLVGGPGNDSANGGPGSDSCSARDVRRSC